VPACVGNTANGSGGEGRKPPPSALDCKPGILPLPPFGGVARIHRMRATAGRGAAGRVAAGRGARHALQRQRLPPQRVGRGRRPRAMRAGTGALRHLRGKKFSLHAPMCACGGGRCSGSDALLGRIATRAAQRPKLPGRPMRSECMGPRSRVDPHQPIAMARRQRMIGSEKRSQQVTAVHSSSQHRTSNCCDRPCLPQSHPGALSMQFYFKAQSQHDHSML